MPIIDQIVHLIGVILQIVEFIHVVQREDEFVAVMQEHALGKEVSTMPHVLADELIRPCGIFPIAAERQYAAAVHIVGRVYAGGIQNGGGRVHIGHQLFGSPAPFDCRRPADRHGHAHDLLNKG